MPIKGLTSQAAFPRVGILRKGAEKKGNRPGEDLDHFRFTSENPEVVTLFHAVYGDRPRSINCILPYRTTEENFASWREAWVAGGLMHRCDGEDTVVLRMPDGRYSTDKHRCPGGCEPVGRLTLIIPEFKRLASVTALTTSTHDILNLQANLQMLEFVRGDLRGIPLVLTRRRAMVSVPESFPKGHPRAGQPTGRRLRREKWLLFIEAREDWVERQIVASQVAAFQLGDGLPEVEAESLDDNGHVVIDNETGEILDTTAAVDTAHDLSVDPPGFAEADVEWVDEGQAVPDEPVDPGDVLPGWVAGIRAQAGWVDGQRLVDGEPITTKQRPLLVGLIKQAVGSDGAVPFLQSVVAVQSTAELTKAEASALIDFLGWSQNISKVDPAVLGSCRELVREAAIEAGQLALDMGVGDG